MPFVEVAAGLRDALRGILNHGFSPHLASTGIHCLVADVPLALRNHIFVHVPASFGEQAMTPTFKKVGSRCHSLSLDMYIHDYQPTCTIIDKKGTTGAPLKYRVQPLGDIKKYNFCSGAALMWGVASVTIKVLLCYLKQSTASRRAAHPGLPQRR
eukprot:COSAG01_NODE_3601_length_5888_cov_506.113146_5_plen_155_part_00